MESFTKLTKLKIIKIFKITLINNSKKNSTL